MKWIKKSKTAPNETKLRQECCRLSKEGKNVSDIGKLLNRTRPWVYKWLKRAKTKDPQWYLDESKEPKNKVSKIEQAVEKDIVDIRKTLTERDTKQTRYRYYGAIAIHQELDKKGYKDKPNLSTINRVIKRHGLIEKEQKARDTNKQAKVYYPEIRAMYPGHIHQLDLVTPRYIKGFGKTISVNRVDVYSGHANLNQYLSKGADNIVSFIIDDGKEYGIPAYLQLDNEASFKGSLYHPRTFGKLTRFCLNFGIEVIFIPFSEPWRNGYIESFNSRYDERLWQSTNFRDLIHLRQESGLFKGQHNQYQTYKKEHFSKQKQTSYTKKFFPKEFQFDLETQLPITKGKIHFVRLVQENGKINILNENFFISTKLCFEYVWATINTKEQKLYIYNQQHKESKRELIKTIDYRLRESAKKQIPISKFC